LNDFADLLVVGDDPYWEVTALRDPIQADDDPYSERRRGIRLDDRELLGRAGRVRQLQLGQQQPWRQGMRAVGQFTK